MPAPGQRLVRVAANACDFATEPIGRLKRFKLAFGFELALRDDESAVRSFVNVQFNSFSAKWNLVSPFGYACCPDQRPERIEARFGNRDFLLEACSTAARFYGDEVLFPLLAQPDLNLSVAQR